MGSKKLLIGMKHLSFEDLKNKSIAIVTQQGTTGPSHDMRDFLMVHVKKLLFIGHPLLFLPENFNKSSKWEFFSDGKKMAEGHARNWRGPELILYCKDFLYGFIWFFNKIHRVDIFIGVGNINALVGIYLQKIGLVKKTIFYCIDYVPVRFANKIINKIYHLIDKYVVENATVVWNLSPRMIEGRQERWGRNLGKQIVVPIGIWYDRISKNRSDEVHRNEIVYLGTLLEKQGLDLCIEAIDDLRHVIPTIRLSIIGSGPYEKTLRNKVSQLGLGKHVFFEGYVKSHTEVERRVSQASLALAMYDKTKDTFSYYADPGKVKVYLACGVPVLITDIPFIARQIQEQRCGFLIEYDKETIVQIIKTYLKQPNMMKSYKENAEKFAKNFDWPAVIKNAFEKSSL